MIRPCEDEYSRFPWTQPFASRSGHGGIFPGLYSGGSLDGHTPTATRAAPNNGLTATQMPAWDPAGLVNDHDVSPEFLDGGPIQPWPYTHAFGTPSEVRDYAEPPRWRPYTTSTSYTSPYGAHIAHRSVRNDEPVDHQRTVWWTQQVTLRAPPTYPPNPPQIGPRNGTKTLSVQPVASPQSQGSQSPPATPNGPLSQGGKIAIPRHNSQAAVQTQQPMQSGPLSRRVEIPPRPRPGRKPIPHEDAQDRRRMQNRMAQRNFRDKRQQRLKETQDELSLVRAEQSATEGSLRNQIDALQNQVRTMSLETKATEAKLRDLQEDYHRIKRENEQLRQATAPREGAALPTPPHAQETDFTNFMSRFGSRNPLGRTTTNDNPNLLLSDQMDIDDRCGFCTDDSNCACKAAALKTTTRDGCGFCTDLANCTCKEAEKPAPSPEIERTTPGNCDLCRADPKRAQACRDMATRTTLGQFRPSTWYEQPHPSNVTSLPPASSISSPSEAHMSCSNFIDKVAQRPERLASIKELFGSQIQAYPARNGKGYELAEKEAAQVLQTLSRRNTMKSGDEMKVDSGKK